MKVSVNDAKNQFSDMLNRIAIGEEVIITDKGDPVAKLVPMPAFTVPDDFNDPLPKEIEDLF